MGTYIFDPCEDYFLSSTLDKGGQLTVSLMEVDTAKFERGLTLPAVPVSYFAPCAAVVFQWGDFEREFDALIFKLVAAAKFPQNQVPRGFTRRYKIAKKLTRALLASHPQAIDYVIKILSAAKSLYKERNVIAHGQLSCQARVQASDGANDAQVDVCVYAEGYASDRPFTMLITKKRLEELFYEIGSLTSALRLLLLEGKAHELPSRDISALSALLR